MIDDHSRVAYTEILDSQNAIACAGFMLRASQWFASLGFRIDRVMADNAFAAELAREHRCWAGRVDGWGSSGVVTVGPGFRISTSDRGDNLSSVEEFPVVVTALPGDANRRAATDLS